MCCREIECLAYCNIVRNSQLFMDLILYKSVVTTMTRSSEIIKERINAQVSMPNGILIQVIYALYTCIRKQSNRANVYHLETHCDN